MIPIHKSLADVLTARHTAFKSFDEMLLAGGNYRPSFYLRGKTAAAQKEIRDLADEYDGAQEARKDPRRAFRGDFTVATPFEPYLFAKLENDGRALLCRALGPRCPMGSRTIALIADFGKETDASQVAQSFAEAGNRHVALVNAAEKVCETLFQDVVNGDPEKALTVTHDQLAMIYELCRVALDSKIGD